MGRRLLSPVVAFPALWLAGVLLAQIHVVHVQRPWSRTMWIVVALVPLTFVCSGLVSSGLVAGRVRVPRSLPAVLATPTRRLRIVLLAFCVLGLLELAHQFAVARTVPLFAADIDRARFAMPGGPTIVLTDLLTVAAVVALVVPEKLFDRSALFELGIAATAIFGFALQGGRGSVILPLIVAFFARGLYRGFPRPEALVGLASLVVVALSTLFYLRIRQHATLDFESELYHQVLPGTPWLLRPLIPIDIALGLNFEALARIVDYFPSAAPFGHWRYDVKLFDRVVPQAIDVQQVSARESPPIVTSTIVGPFWADWGYVAVTVGIAAVAALATGAYEYARRTLELRHVLLGTYLLYVTLFGVYFNLFTQYPDWLVVAPLLFVVGSVAEARKVPGLGRWT